MKDYRQLAAQFRAYKSKVGNRSREAARLAILKMVDDAKRNLARNHNIETGALYDSIREDFEQDAHGFTYKLIADATSAEGVQYAEFIEFGTGRYNQHGDGRQTMWRYKGRDGKWHSTYGSRAYPFVRPAFRSNMGYLTKQMQLAMKVDGSYLNAHGSGGWLNG